MPPGTPADDHVADPGSLDEGMAYSAPKAETHAMNQKAIMRFMG
jgi:hypothetical protein